MLLSKVWLYRDFSNSNKNVLVAPHMSFLLIEMSQNYFCVGFFLFNKPVIKYFY